MSDPAQKRRRRRRLFLVLCAGLAAGTVIAAAAAWWRWSGAPPSELRPGWTAAVRVIAGDGFSEWRDGDVTRARFSEPFDVAVTADGRILVSDGVRSHRIRVVAPDGTVRTVAGREAGFVDGAGLQARFDTPSGLALDPAGTLYIADTGNHAIRRLAADGRVVTIGGDGTPGFRDGPGREALFNGPIDVAIGRDGRLFVADTYNDRIRVIDVEGRVATLAGTGAPGYVDGPAAYAQFDTPAGLTVDRAGNVLVADTGNGVIRQIDPSGHVSTLHPSVTGAFGRPVGIVASPGGEIYVSDERGRIVEAGVSGEVRTLAGSAPGFRDGSGADARFRRPGGLAFAGAGRLIVADAGNALVRAVTAAERRDWRTPPSPLIAPRFDAAAFGQLPLLWPVMPMEGPHEIAGTMGEARGADGAERFHAGVDVRVEEGTTVLAVREGVVASPAAAADFATLNESLRIGDVAYVHVRVGRTREGDVLDPDRFVATADEHGRVVRIRVRRGTRFRTGDAIATANAFNHVHLNVGWPGEEHNALRFRLPHFEDQRPPTIARGGIKLFDEAGQPLAARERGRIVVSGRVRIVVDAWDQADGNRPNRRLGLYALGYRVMRTDGTPVPGFEGRADNIRFDQLSLTPEAARLVYAPGSGIPFYGRRITRFLYIATNIFRDGVAANDYWDTSLLPPGDYVLRVFATDIQQNTAMANRDLPVTIKGDGGQLR